MIIVNIENILLILIFMKYFLNGSLRSVNIIKEILCLIFVRVFPLFC